MRENVQLEKHRNKLLSEQNFIVLLKNIFASKMQSINYVSQVDSNFVREGASETKEKPMDALQDEIVNTGLVFASVSHVVSNKTINEFINYTNKYKLPFVVTTLIRKKKQYGLILGIDTFRDEVVQKIALMKNQRFGTSEFEPRLNDIISVAFQRLLSKIEFGELSMIPSLAFQNHEVSINDYQAEAKEVLMKNSAFPTSLIAEVIKNTRRVSHEPVMFFSYFS